MKFSDEEIKPSDVIEGLNEFYRKVGERQRFEAKYGLSGAAGPFLVIKRRCGGLKTYFYNRHAVEEAITWLREECDIFYTMGMKWEDMKHKMPLKAAEKEYGTADIREMYIDGQETLEGLRTLYYAVATRHERALRRLDECLNDDRDWPETSYMLEYIRKRVETADKKVEYLCKESDDLRNQVLQKEIQVQNLKDLINQIHEESDI